MCRNQPSAGVTNSENVMRRLVLICFLTAGVAALARWLKIQTKVVSYHAFANSTEAHSVFLVGSLPLVSTSFALLVGIQAPLGPRVGKSCMQQANIFCRGTRKRALETRLSSVLWSRPR